MFNSQSRIRSSPHLELLTTLQSQLLIRPDWGDWFCPRDADTSTSTAGDPIRNRRQAKLVPDAFHRLAQSCNKLIGMAWGGRDPQPFLSNGDRGVVNCLDIDALIEKQLVAGELGEGSV